MIKLNEHEVEFFLSSGSRGLDGRGYWWKFWERFLERMKLIDPSLFAVVLKSISVKPHKGNRPLWRVVKFISEDGRVVSPVRALIQPHSVAGVVNAIGLDNPGFDDWLNKIYPKIVAKNLKVVFSAVLTGQEKEDEFLEMISRLNDLGNIIAVEFNASCPNIDNELLTNSEKVVALTAKIAQRYKRPIILKLGISQDFLRIASQVKEFIQGISINALPWPVVFPDKISPLARYGGGAVSGQIGRANYQRMILKLTTTVKTPIITPTWDYSQVKISLVSLGASAVSFGSVGLLYPRRPTRFAQRWLKEKRRKDGKL